MRTRKAVSIVSFNSIEFLKQRLDKLVQDSVIDFYVFVKHKVEDDEYEHIHLYMQPTNYINTIGFLDYFIEDNVFFRCTNIVSAKFDTWYLYACHDKAYLMSKGQSRKYHYSYEDFYTNDYLWFLEMVRTIDRGELDLLSKIVKAYENGISFIELVKDNQIPVSRYRICEDLYKLLKNSDIER